MNPTPSPELPANDRPPVPVPDYNDTWARVELHRWQYGELPQPSDRRPLVIAEGLRNMAQAIENGCKRDATHADREAMPEPFNVVSVMRFVAKMVEKETDSIKMSNGSSIRIAQGRNEPCQCGSGKKFKKCCLVLAALIMGFCLFGQAKEKTQIEKSQIVTGREAAIETARKYLFEGGESVRITTVLWYHEQKEGDHKVEATWYGK